MASGDSELIDEARGLTDYDSSIISDSDFQSLVAIGKEELKSELGDTSLTFYEEETHNATRALFWFVCIAAKIKVGEIAGIEIGVGDIDASQPSGTSYDFWFMQFSKRKAAAANDLSPGPSSTMIGRANRSYGDN